MILTIKATPNSPKTEIKRQQNGILYISVAASPEKNEANEELIKFLAKTYGCEKKDIKILSGATARLKKVKVSLAGDR